jgi:hypothetical protein
VVALVSWQQKYMDKWSMQKLRRCSERPSWAWGGEA